MPFSPGKRLVVLGAGATKGAEAPPDRQCAPPLNADFFTQLQRITRAKHAETVADVIADVISLFGPDFTLALEDYFTHIESFIATVARAGYKHPTFTSSYFHERRARLMRALAAVLEESTDVSKADAMVCQHHRGLVEELNPQDTVLSFNYDCVMDHALRRHGAGKWSAYHGYTFQKPSRIKGHEYWSPNSPATRAQDSIYLLKLHGSLNWQLPDGDDALDAPINLKQRLYQLNGTPRFTIIPPEHEKEIDTGNFRILWRNAERAIRTAEVIALVGFSFTPTDLHVDSLFRFALSAGNLRTLVIANPDKDHRRRIRHVFARPLADGAIVRQYDYLHEFVAALPDALS